MVTHNTQRWSHVVALAFMVLGNLLFWIPIGRAATADAGGIQWLITPEEAAMAPAPESSLLTQGGLTEAGREGVPVGPIIEVVQPTDGGKKAGPVEVLVRFTPRAEPVDVSSLKVSVLKFIPIDITDRIKPYCTQDGIAIKEAQIPAGKHVVRITVADAGGGITVKEIAFEVL